MKLLNFQSENLNVDWISFNLEGSLDPIAIANRFSNYFTPNIRVDDIPKVSFHGLKKKYKVSIRQYTGCKSYWIGTRVIWSGKDAAYFYKLLKTDKFDWSLLKFDGHRLSLGRIDLYFSRPNDLNHTSALFDSFLLNSRKKVQSRKKTKHIKLQDFPDGVMLKINRRNNSVHYRVYQKDDDVRFEIELKHRQTRLVEDYLFQNKLDMFEHQLVIQYFKSSGQMLCLDYSYADWVIDFQRRNCQLVNLASRSLVTSYLENKINTFEEEGRLLHLLQFLSFIRSLGLNPFKDCERHRMKKQYYYSLKFPLSKFLNFTGITVSHSSEREKIIDYFKQLLKLDPIVKEFSSGAFRACVSFMYVACDNPSGKSWVIEVYAAEELFWFQYPFELPNAFLIAKQKNDLRLKVRLLRALAVENQEKILDLEEFFNTVSVPNKRLTQLKLDLIQLLVELVKSNIIRNEIEIVLKSGKKRSALVGFLTTSDITRRVKHIKFYEKVKK